MGLNNILTADVVTEDVLFLQTWLNTGYNRHPQNFVEFKYSPYKDIEIGVDWKANDVSDGHAMLQAKYAFDIDGDLWRGIIGFADLSDNREHNGDFFPFAATSPDLKTFRVHFGYAHQPHNEAFFGGIDKMFTFLDRDLMLRFGRIHINDKEDMKLSTGFIYDLAANTKTNRIQSTGLGELLSNITKNMLIESWVTMPSTGNQEVYTIKLNYVSKELRVYTCRIAVEY